jgi:hypothetical protein
MVRAVHRSRVEASALDEARRGLSRAPSAIVRAPSAIVRPRPNARRGAG